MSSCLTRPNGTPVAGNPVTLNTSSSVGFLISYLSMFKNFETFETSFFQSSFVIRGPSILLNPPKDNI